MISGIIGHSDALNKRSAVFHGERITGLPQGFSFLPLDDENLFPIVGADEGPPLIAFRHLTPTLQSFLIEASKVGMLAYVETEYFGGEGLQGAALFDNGAMIFNPKVNEFGAINQALEILGVKRSRRGQSRFRRFRRSRSWSPS